MARLTSEEQDTAVIGFLDESTKAVHANTARMWSVGKPYRITNYTVNSKLAKLLENDFQS